MELNFLGRGGAFFVGEGNTAAYFIEDKNFFLIDCGESVFAKIKSMNLLAGNGIENVYCFITHMHSDHVGSLSSLIYYCAYGEKDYKAKFHLVCPEALRSDLLPMLGAQGNLSLINEVSTGDLRRGFESFNSVRYMRTIHQAYHPALSIEFSTDEGLVFYSGDTKQLDFIGSYAGQRDKIAKMYVEASLAEYPNSVHLTLKGLDEVIPADMRHKVYLMHFDCAECIIEAKNLGFRVVECIE
jgi:ribonuclease BN (tRNA processing enzyme)